MFNLAEITNKLLKVKDETANTLLTAIELKLRGTVNTQLIGRNIEEIPIISGLAITDTNVKLSNLVDLSKYKSVTFIVTNSHNQPIDVYPQLEDKRTKFWDGTGFVRSADQKAVIPVDTITTNVILNGKFPLVLNANIKSIRFILQAAAVPTTGSITVKGWGVLN